MTELEAIKKEVLQECDEDHVGVWNVIRDVKEFMPHADSAMIQEVTVSVLNELLQHNMIAAGYPTDEGKFVIWQVPASLVIEHIKKQWLCLGRDPDIGEVVWFTTPRKAAA
jgi:hypothetical protein